jgi:hypothetical protein
VNPLGARRSRSPRLSEFVGHLQNFLGVLGKGLSFRSQIDIAFDPFLPRDGSGTLNSFITG